VDGLTYCHLSTRLLIQPSILSSCQKAATRLTVAATVLATATLITGFFGMNVQGAFINIRWPHTGWLILVLLVILTGVEIWYFRRRGWL